MDEMWSRPVDLGRRFSAAPSSDSIEGVDETLATVNRLCGSVRVAADFLSSPAPTGPATRLIAIPTFSQLGADASSLAELRQNTQLPLSDAERDDWKTASEEIVRKARRMVTDLFLEAFTDNLRLAAEYTESEQDVDG